MIIKSLFKQLPTCKENMGQSTSWWLLLSLGYSIPHHQNCTSHNYNPCHTHHSASSCWRACGVRVGSLRHRTQSRCGCTQDHSSRPQSCWYHSWPRWVGGEGKSSSPPAPPAPRWCCSGWKPHLNADAGTQSAAGWQWGSGACHHRDLPHGSERFCCGGSWGVCCSWRLRLCCHRLSVHREEGLGWYPANSHDDSWTCSEDCCHPSWETRCFSHSVNCLEELAEVEACLVCELPGPCPTRSPSETGLFSRGWSALRNPDSSGSGHFLQPWAPCTSRSEDWRCCPLALHLWPPGHHSHRVSSGAHHTWQPDAPTGWGGSCDVLQWWLLCEHGPSSERRNSGGLYSPGHWRC